MNVILFDDATIRKELLPFTFTRPIAALRTGILTIGEKWEKYISESVSYLTEDYLQEKFPLQLSGDHLFVNGAICPDPSLVQAVRSLATGQSLMKGQLHIATRTGDKNPKVEGTHGIEYAGTFHIIDDPCKLFQDNAPQIVADFELITAGRKSAGWSDPHTRVYAADQIFVEEGAVIQAAVLNASTGPIYIGKNTEIQEGSLIRGPFVLGDHSVLNMGSKMRGNITIGPMCKIGGEVSNAVVLGYSNKAHDGFLGSSVIGEWCNLGADTNTSNLKNNYDAVKLWSYAKGGFRNTGLTFVGLMMGDHSKCGINTMFNSGTVTGVSANIFGDGYPRNFIPSFAWGGAAGFSTFQLSRALETAERAMGRRGAKLSDADRHILTTAFEMTAHERVWEKKP